MSTARQFAANRENAKKSTGPVTPEGIARSSRNRLSHGFASNTRFIKDEEPAEFYALLNDFTREHQPATPTEQVLVEKMAHNQWISLRSIRLQADTLRSVHVAGIPNTLGLLIRYQTSADRAFYKAHAELLKAQKERKKSEIGFESRKSDKAPEIPAQLPQNPPDAPKKPTVQTFTAAAGGIFVPDIISAATKMADDAAELMQAV